MARRSVTHQPPSRESRREQQIPTWIDAPATVPAWRRQVGAVVAVAASVPAMYVLLLGMSLGAGATLGGYGEAARPPSAAWFEPLVAVFVVAWLAACVVGIVAGRRRLSWTLLCWAVLAVETIVALAFSRWFPPG